MLELSPGVLAYPDISSAQAGIDLAGAGFVVCKVTQGTGYLNPDYQAERSQAQLKRVLFAAYHFLERGNAAAQAAFAHTHAWDVPLMLDAETDPATGHGPSVADVAEFISAYRRLGGALHLLYLPHWYWAEIGSPSLTAAGAGLRLASSNYTTYSDTGPGWEGYGGLTVATWQYTSTATFGGKTVDLNAWKGTPAQLMDFMTNGPADYQLSVTPTITVAMGWKPVPEADHYVIACNGEVIDRTSGTHVQGLPVHVLGKLEVTAIVHSKPVPVGTWQHWNIP
jgi:hypothetical protein